MGDELDELIDDPEYVKVIEWGDIVHDVLPEGRMTITIKQTGDDTRDITISYPEKLAYLLEEVRA
jgi:tRNA A37 threonylcarbamoyladenosine biosynthesis protein TsaE